MSWSKTLEKKLKSLAIKYAQQRGCEYTKGKNVILFKNVKYNFHPDSHQNIENNKKWSLRVKNAGTWSSSNSSAVLLMNIFCNPRVARTKGIQQLLGLPEWVQPEFEVSAFVNRRPSRNRNTARDNTRLDMVIEDVIVEAKLTEPNFGKSIEVLNYYGLETVFNVNMLDRQGDKFKNYQLIRNVLAARQMKKRFILICDYRRPDLIRDYLELIKCIRNYSDRKLCNLLTWQDICRAAPEALKEYLLEKYSFY